MLGQAYTSGEEKKRAAGLKRHLCECGCGQPTKIAKYTDTGKGWVKGQAVRFLNGHNVELRRLGLDSFDAVDGPLREPCFVHRKVPNSKGYVQIRLNGRLVSAHRASYERTYGPVPEGMQLDHLCRNRACINPLHLEPVTCKENIVRGHRARATT